MTTVGLPPTGDLVEIDGRHLWVDQAGMGGPAVVFAPGAGSFALDFWLAHQVVATTSMSILYDRAGTGWSEDIALPRSAADVTDELRKVLRASGTPGPYVLVGHSLGGLYVQHYAQRFPSDVAGMVLLDPAHEDWDSYMPEHLQLAKNQTGETEMPELPEAFIAQYRAAFAEMFAAFPEPLRDQVVDRHFSPDRLPTGFREGANVLALFDEVRGGGDRPDVPLIILSGSGIDPVQTMLLPEDQLHQQIAGSQQLYDALAARAHGEHRILGDASHVSIPMARPDAVADAVTDVLARIRAGT